MSKVTITCVLGLLIGVIGGGSIYADPFTPDDLYFHRDTPVSGWPGQWHLYNEHTPGLDVNIMGAWAMGYTGAGVVIGIVDQSLETTHPDLALNYVAEHSWDFADGDSDPNPVGDDEKHGTSVAGVAAARGGNGIGVTGAAPRASLAGLRVDLYSSSSIVDATTHHSSGANTSIRVKNHSYSEPAPYYMNDYLSPQITALETSIAAGTIHCMSAGNGRNTPGQDVSKIACQSLPSIITVAAIGSDGKFADYSSFGATITVTTPSCGSFVTSDARLKITTTDRTGAIGYNGTLDEFPDENYTSRFGGTSSASPLVAGIMALGVEAQPNLNGRFAKHLLARTSKIVDPGDLTEESDGGWRTNAAGISFNQNYGFGLIDATAFCQQAIMYTGVTDLLTESIQTTDVSEMIPHDGTSVTRTFSLESIAALEEVSVHLNIVDGYYINHLRAYLTSPSGTHSRLFIEDRLADGTEIDWTFTTNVFWGENPCGEWELTIFDARALAFEDGCTWNSYAITTRMGELIAVPEPATLALLTIGSLGLAVLRRRRKM